VGDKEDRPRPTRRQELGTKWSEHREIIAGGDLLVPVEFQRQLSHVGLKLKLKVS
jgi:hypothetical protein